MKIQKHINKLNKVIPFLLPRKKENVIYRGYEKIVDNSEFEIYQVKPLRKKIVAAWGSIICKMPFGNNDVYIYPDFKCPLLRVHIRFNSSSYPGLLKGSNIQRVLIVPYLRTVKRDLHVKSWRLIVITDKCQVFHNFPARGVDIDGEEQFGDIYRFEESAIWDIPGRKYPSKEMKCGELERYMPFLPDEAYEYHPAIAPDDYVSQYGNRGFAKTSKVNVKDKEVSVSRFYFPIRCADANSFEFMGGYEPDYKMSVIGTYRANKNVGVRTCIFASSDGGRNWYAKYEFSDEGDYSSFQQGEKTYGHNFGNPIDGRKISNSDIKGELFACKRVLSHQGSGFFEWGDRLNISKVDLTNPIIIHTNNPHGFETGNIVAIQSDENHLSCLVNNTVSSVSCGNGLLYKIEIIDEYSFKIFEYVAGIENNYACRHIHSINKIKDGWIIATGETYPNGWLLYMQMKESDTYNERSASDDFNIYVLNSGPLSVQRVVGAILCDDNDNTIIYASDHDTLPKKDVIGANGVRFSRSSLGIFKGKLNQVNDYNSFQTIYEAKEPSFFFKEIDGNLIFCGMRGEVAISKDKGKSWRSSRIPKTFFHYFGRTYNQIVVDDFILRIK